MSNTPNIRFKGFTDDWEQRKVTDLGEIYIGLVTTMTEHYTDKGHLLIRNSDIKDGYFEFGENPIYLDEEFSEQNKSRMHQLGDVITVHTGDIGTSAVIGENEVNSIGFATIVTRPNKEILDSNFFATYLNTDTHKQWAISMATGDGRSNYNLKDYTKLIVPVPQIEEQKKIASCICNLNNLITLHQRKCDETKELKKYMLQKMFPQQGEKKPAIRFEGFTDDWEQRKLGDLLNETREKTSVEDEDTLLSCAIDGMFLNSELFSHFRGSSNIGYLKVKKNDLILSAQNLHLGNCNVNLRFEHGIISPAYKVYELINCDPLFMQAWVKQDKTKDFFLKASTEGASVCRKNIVWEDLYKQELPVPKINEQVKIGAFFQNLDNLITLHQRKCDEMKELKNFMLQNMFPKKG